eukprot:gene25947-28298_t
MLSLKYLSSYSEQTREQVSQLLTQNRLREVLLKRYPKAHDLRTDKALFQYIQELKTVFLRNAEPINKVTYDSKIQVINHALGLHTSISRVQGGKLKAKHEIRIATLFKEVPIEFLRMIAVHELSHIKEKQHDKAFYQLCSYMEPNYHQYEFDLRLYLTELDISGRRVWGELEMAAYLEEQENTVRAKAVTLPRLLEMRSADVKIAMLTCYDASFASLMDKSGVDMLLVGDSLGNVCQGHSTTLSVTIADIAYHTASVVRGNQTAFVAADMPFGTYGTPEVAFENAVKLMQAGAQIVKLEGGIWLSETVRFLVTRGIPVFAHLGLTPQYVHQLGGFKVQGKTTEGAQRLKEEALALEAAGASMLLLEAIPASLGKDVTNALSIPTIGIGAGPDCSGQ